MDSADQHDGESWESVHICPRCGHIINLSELDLRAVTTGIEGPPSSCSLT